MQIKRYLWAVVPSLLLAGSVLAGPIQQEQQPALSFFDSRIVRERSPIISIVSHPFLAMILSDVVDRD